MSDFFPRLIPYSFVLVRLFLELTLRFHHGEYISELNSSLRSFGFVPPPPPSSKRIMPQSQTTLPPVRRVVTAHDSSGKEIIRSDSSLPSQVDQFFAKELPQMLTT